MGLLTLLRKLKKVQMHLSILQYRVFYPLLDQLDFIVSVVFVNIPFFNVLASVFFSMLSSMIYHASIFGFVFVLLSLYGF